MVGYLYSISVLFVLYFAQLDKKEKYQLDWL